MFNERERLSAAAGARFLFKAIEGMDPPEVRIMVEKPVIIVGGGIAGLTVAKTLIDNGLPSTVVERAPSLGGHVRKWACMATDRCQRCFCCLTEGLVQEVSASEKVQVLTGRELSSVVSNGDGKLVRLKDVTTGEEMLAEASALVLATGFEPYDAAEKIFWGHGRLKGVYTLPEVDALLREDTLSAFNNGTSGLRVAFLQCVGSRDAAAGANYCSQYCCKAALRMALKLIHECTEMAVTVFYIDLQIAGKYAGELLKKVEQKKVRLRQGVPGEITQGPDDVLEVVTEQNGHNVREQFDRVILSVGQRPSRAAASLAAQLGVPMSEFGFMEPKSAVSHSLTAVQGIYVAGTCSGPKDIEQTVQHAGQTAEAILADLRRGKLL